MTEFLYYFFLERFSLGEQNVSFNVIKRLLTKNINDILENKVHYSAFYELIGCGLIDRVDDKLYSLSSSIIYKNPKSNYSIGINLPEYIIEENKLSIIDRKLGIVIFSTCSISLVDSEVEEYIYNFKNYISRFKSIKSICSSWSKNSKEYFKDHRALEKFNFNDNNWNKVSGLENGYHLYKTYLHNDFYFKYIFVNNHNLFLIEPEDYEKINLIKFSKTSFDILKYYETDSELHIKPYSVYPIFFYKTIFLNHLLTIGSFPCTENKLNISKNNLMQLTRKLNLNVELV